MDLTDPRASKLQECDDRKLGVIISAFQFLPLIVLFKQERGDRGESVGVITGLLIVDTSAPAGMEVVWWRAHNWTSVGGAL